MDNTPSSPAEDLVISTPERVAFQYPVAGPGSRFLAQAIDLLILAGCAIVVGIASVTLGAAFKDARIGAAVFGVLSFLLVFGYFLTLESIWNGQTIGKRVFSLRVVGDQGEPARLQQVAVRNLIRIVDWLPVLYGVGLVALFVQGGGKRLGDLAAATVVVRERRGGVSLSSLGGPAPSPSAAAEPAPASIWQSPPPMSDAPAQAAPAGAAPPPAVRELEPGLRRFVVAYGGRRADLDPRRRAQLAAQVEGPLRAAAPQLVAQYGVSGALDYLADREGGALLPPHEDAPRAFGFGIAGLITAFLCGPFGLICSGLALFFAVRALRAIRGQPGRFSGRENARHGRTMAVIGLAVSGLWLGLWGLAVLRP